MNRLHQPGSLPIDTPDSVPNPAYTPKQPAEPSRPVPAPERPAPREPVKTPEKVSATNHPSASWGVFLTRGD